MNAQEMFEQLGYRLERKENYIRYRKGSCLEQEVFFGLLEKEYLSMDYVTGLIISIELHQAISQQLKELGWI